MFQSTPAIADGRTKVVTNRVKAPTKFQSTPAIADGRTRGSAVMMFHASSFNPRPPSLTGEPRGEPRFIGYYEVSIHARHR